MTGQRRVLVVRCPAWRPEPGPGEPAARAFEQVVSAVQEFCPRIEVLRPGLCAFGARGPARYFGGEADLGRKVAAAVAGLGYECGVGIADGMFAALLSSRDSARIAEPVVVPPGGTAAFLAPRAVTVLGAPDLADLLVRLGIRTLGEFAAVPAAEAGNRFGVAGLAAHRIARGLDPRPLAARPPAADLSVQAEFDPPAAESERVVFAAKALAATLHARLAAAGLACVRVQVHLVSDNGEELSRLWRHDGLLSEFAVAERVRWQLDGWQASRRAGAAGQAGAAGSGGTGDEGIQAAGICLLRLVPDQLVQDQGRQLGLWGDAVVSDRVARAAIRVQAMLGHGAVRQPLLSGGRNPSDQAVLVPFGDTHPSRKSTAQVAGDEAGGRPVDRPWPGQIPAPAPATVYPVPRPARVTDGAGSVVEVTGRGQVQGDPARLSVAGGPAVAITAWTGPWPVTERWWDSERACRKARFQLVTADGGAWLAVVQDGRWLSRGQLRLERGWPRGTGSQPTTRSLGVPVGPDYGHREPAGARTPRRHLHLGHESQLGDQLVARRGPAEPGQRIAARPGAGNRRQPPARHRRHLEPHRQRAAVAAVAEAQLECQQPPVRAELRAGRRAAGRKADDPPLPGRDIEHSDRAAHLAGPGPRDACRARSDDPAEPPPHLSGDRVPQLVGVRARRRSPRAPAAARGRFR